MSKVQRNDRNPRSRSVRLFLGGATIVASLAVGVSAAMAVPTADGTPGAQETAESRNVELRKEQAESRDTRAAQSQSPSSSPSPDVAVKPANREAGIKYYDATTDPSKISPPPGMSAEEVANSQAWIERQIATARCMNEQGFPYEFSLWWERPEGMPPAPSAELPGTPEFEALWGSNDSSSPGCWTLVSTPDTSTTN